jgi:hypothetical protein
MGKQSVTKLLIGVGMLLTALALAGPAPALELITAGEAALPATPQLGLHERGITRGPTVVIVSPAPQAGAIKSPLSLKVRFESHGGSQINVETVLLTYMKDPRIDLTQRIRPFIAPTGIDVEDADVPPGTHTLQVNVKDSEGRLGWAEFTFHVAK